MDFDYCLDANNKYWQHDGSINLAHLAVCESQLRSKRYDLLEQSIINYWPDCFSPRSLRWIINRARYIHNSSKIFSYTFPTRLFGLSVYSDLIHDPSFSISQLDSKSLYSECTSVIDLAKSLQFHLYGTDYYIPNFHFRYATPFSTSQAWRSRGPLGDFHNDQSRGITYLIYLSNVNQNSGPFQFIDNIDPFFRSFFLMAVQQYNLRRYLKLNIDPFEYLQSLPLLFRSLPSIGDYLSESRAEFLSSRIVSLEGNSGTSILFNGQFLLHRGGKPLSENRLAAMGTIRGIIKPALRFSLDLLKNTSSL